MVPPSRDTTKAVVDRLKLDPPLPPKIAERTQNSLRLMKVKYPIGTFGKTDNELKRSCALLEYIAREEGHRIPIDRLAKVASMKKKDFVAFHEMVGNFNENSTLPRSSVCSSSSQSATIGVARGNAIGKKMGPDTIFLTKSTIPSLAMQLGVFLPNSNSVAVEAQRLFQQIVLHLQHNKKDRVRISGLEDIRRNQSTYEAVCFYLTATKDKHRTNGRPGTTGRGGNRPSYQQQQQHRSSSSSYHDGDDFDKHLDLSTFLDICGKDFTPSQFQMILQYVSELWQEIQDATHHPLMAAGHDPNGAALSSSRRTLDDTIHRTAIGEGPKDQGSRKRSRTEAGSNTKATTNPLMILIEQQDAVEGSTSTWVDINSNNNNNDSDSRGVDQSRIVYSPIFLEWKKRMLAAAFDNARSLYEQRDGTTDIHQTDPSNQKDAILDYAAQEVLRRYKLLE